MMGSPVEMITEYVRVYRFVSQGIVVGKTKMRTELFLATCSQLVNPNGRWPLCGQTAPYRATRKVHRTENGYFGNKWYILLCGVTRNQTQRHL